MSAVFRKRKLGPRRGHRSVLTAHQRENLQEFGVGLTDIADESSTVGHREAFRVGTLNCRMGDQPRWGNPWPPVHGKRCFHHVDIPREPHIRAKAHTFVHTGRFPSPYSKEALPRFGDYTTKWISAATCAQ